MASDDRPAARLLARASAAPGDVGEADANSPAAIHLRVPREVKGRWVAKSRAAGLKLGDWIV